MDTLTSHEAILDELWMSMKQHKLTLVGHMDNDNMTDVVRLDFIHTTHIQNIFLTVVK